MCFCVGAHPDTPCWADWDPFPDSGTVYQFARMYYVQNGCGKSTNHETGLCEFHRGEVLGEAQGPN